MAKVLTAPLPVATALVGQQAALNPHSFKRGDARAEANELAFWLDTENLKKPLKERDQVLRFFLLRKQLCALTSMLWGNLQPKSLFERANDLDPNELRPKLGRRLLGGMAQITDWVYFLESASAAHKKQWFTFEPNKVLALLVVGCDHYFEKYGTNDFSRYEWLQDKLRIGEMPVVIRTFDGLKSDLITRLTTYV